MMIEFACAPDSVRESSSSRDSASIARWARAVRRCRNRCDCGVVRVGACRALSPDRHVTGQVGEDAPGGVRDGLILPELVFAGVDEPGQALREAFLQGLTGQLAGRTGRRPRGAAPRTSSNSDGAAVSARRFHRPAYGPFHLPSDITHERPLFPLVLARRASRSPDEPAAEHKTALSASPVASPPRRTRPRPLVRSLHETAQQGDLLAMRGLGQFLGFEDHRQP